MIAIALISGLALGFLFFGGLWFTVRKTLGSKYVAFWLLGSSILRMTIVLIGFYFVSQGGLPQLLCSVAGFIAARFLVMWLTKRIEQKETIIMEGNKL